MATSFSSTSQRPNVNFPLSPTKQQDDNACTERGEEDAEAPFGLFNDYRRRNFYKGAPHADGIVTCMNGNEMKKKAPRCLKHARSSHLIVPATICCVGCPSRASPTHCESGPYTPSHFLASTSNSCCNAVPTCGGGAIIQAPKQSSRARYGRIGDVRYGCAASRYEGEGATGSIDRSIVCLSMSEVRERGISVMNGKVPLARPRPRPRHETENKQASAGEQKREGKTRERGDERRVWLWSSSSA